ncbi:toprim domain-containing protein [Salmonella enterica]|nr:helicase [Salmonella enterica subsp. enterica serovar Thompson]
MARLITDIKNRARGLWGDILPQLGIDIPAKGKHGPCPVCGGNDRFHYIDDHDDGDWHCRQCKTKKVDGLDLVSRALKITNTEAAKRVGEIIGADTRSPDKPARKEASDGQKPAPDIAAKVAAMSRKTTPKESLYLAGKGLAGFTPPTLPDGKIFLALVDANGAPCGAQTITPDGAKSYLKGTRKKGAFIVPDPLPDAPETIIIAEGIATAISAGVLHSGAVVAALDAGNLKPVALALRGRYPKAKIIIAADNDYHAPGELDEHGKPKRNAGKISGEEAAAACGGWLALPPGEAKTDWNDYHQLKGVEAAKAAFNASLKNMGEKYCTLPGGITLSDDEIAELEALNNRYTHTRIGKSHVVASVTYDDKGEKSHDFLELEDFKKFFLSDEFIAKKNKGDAWLRWKGKNQKLGGVGFYPLPDKCPDNVYNLFVGWNVKPIPGDVSVYLNHVREVICDNNEEAYNYVIGWMAHIIQRPDEKPSVAIVMKAVQGAGKGSFVKPLRQITGYHGVRIESIQSLTSKFNALLENKLLAFIDEATINSIRDADIVKGLVSEETAIIERKGIDKKEVPNLLRMILASNNERILRASIRERRYLVLEPSSKYAQQNEYFSNLYKWTENKGASHLMHYLLQVDISNFDPRRAPATKALMKEILSNLPVTESYIYSELCNDEPFRGQARIVANDEIERFVVYCRDCGNQITMPAARSRLGLILKKIGLEALGRSDTAEGKYYPLPAREDADGWRSVRGAFAEHLNSDFDTVFGITDW